MNESENGKVNVREEGGCGGREFVLVFVDFGGCVGCGVGCGVVK